MTAENGTHGQIEDRTIFLGREKESERLRFLLRTQPSDLRILVLWGPSGIGKSSLLRHVLTEHAEYVNKQKTPTPMPVLSLDFADQRLSASPLDVAVEMYFQFSQQRKQRLLRFELLWATLARRRGYPAGINRRRAGAIEKGFDPIELASAWLDAAEHIPFLGAGVKAGKFLAKAGDTYLEHRAVQKVTEWFTNRLSSEAVSPISLKELLDAANTQELKRLIPSAMSADFAEWLATASTDEAWGVVIAVDKYERLTVHEELASWDTFPLRLVKELSTHAIPGLVILASQNELAEKQNWNSKRAIKEEQHELQPFEEEQARSYARARGILDERVILAMYRLSRGSPGLLAALIDLLRNEADASLWDSLTEAQNILGELDASTIGRSRFMTWYVRRLRRQLAPRDDHLFNVIVAASVLRSFDDRELSAVLGSSLGIRSALERLRRYSFLVRVGDVPAMESHASGRPGGVPLPRFRVHELVRHAVQLSDDYDPDVRLGHERAREHYGRMTDEADPGARRRGRAEDLYHLTCLDQEQGLTAAEAEFGRAIAGHDLAFCDYIVEALSDAPVIEAASRARLFLLDGRLKRARWNYGAAISILSQARNEAWLDEERGSRVAIDAVRNLAECYRLWGRPSEAFRSWQELVDLAARTRDPGVRFFAEEGLLRSHLDADNIPAALVHGEQAIRRMNILKEFGSPLYPELVGDRLQVRQGHLYRQLCRAARFGGNYVTARDYASEAVSLYAQSGDDFLVSWGNLGLGHAVRVLGDHQLALDLAERALTFFGYSYSTGLSAETSKKSEDANLADAAGISKAAQLFLLASLARDLSMAEPFQVSGQPGRVTLEAGRNGAGPLIDHLRLVNQLTTIDPFAPLYSNLVAGEYARWMGEVEVALTNYESVISECTAIGGKVEAAYALLSRADLWRNLSRSNFGQATADAYQAWELGAKSGYPWIVFYAALLAGLVDDRRDRSPWFDRAIESCERLRYPQDASPQRECIQQVLTLVAENRPVGRLVLNYP